MTQDNPGPVYVHHEEELQARIARLEAMLARSAEHSPPPGFAPSIAPLVPLAGTIPQNHATERRKLFEFPILRDLRFIAQMYLDPRYRVSRLAQFGVPGILALCVLNYVVFNVIIIQVMFLSPVAERVVLMVLAVVLFQVLRMEAARYRQVLEYLARIGR